MTVVVGRLAIAVCLEADPRDDAKSELLALGGAVLAFWGGISSG